VAASEETTLPEIQVRMRRTEAERKWIAADRSVDIGDNVPHDSIRKGEPVAAVSVRERETAVFLSTVVERHERWIGDEPAAARVLNPERLARKHDRVAAADAAAKVGVADRAAEFAEAHQRRREQNPLDRQNVADDSVA